METESNTVLSITEKWILPRNVDIFQTDDGTMFFFKSSKKKPTLHVKWQEEFIEGKMPEKGEMRCCGAHGNALYIISKKKVYKAVFTPPETLNIEFLRNLLKGEVIDQFDRGFISRIRHAKKFVYKICDDPNSDGIPSATENPGFIRGIHSGKVIYDRQDWQAFNPKVKKAGENGIVVECSRCRDIYARDDLPYVYVLTDDALLWAFDIETLEFLPPLRIQTDDTMCYIFSFHDGSITLKGIDTSDGETVQNFFTTLKLPKEYLEKTQSIDGRVAEIRKAPKRRIGDIEIVLKKSSRKVLESQTYIYQVEDGTMFYCKFSEPKRLYVKWQGNEIDVGDVCNQIWRNDRIRVFGNAIYFESLDDEQIFKVVFTPPDRMTVSFRDRKQNEEIYGQGMCSRMRDGNKYVYRMCDDPDQDGILISDEALDCTDLEAVHRDIAIFTYRTRDDTPHVRKLRENIIAIETPLHSHISLYSKESSPLIWFIHFNNVFILDTEVMEIVTALQIKDLYTIHSIAGIHDGVLTIRARTWSSERWFMMSVQVPGKYVDRTTATNKTQRQNNVLEWKEIQKQEQSKEQHSCNVREQSEFTSRFAQEFKVNKIIGVGGYEPVCVRVGQRLAQ